MAEDFWHVFKLLVFLCGVSLFVVRVMGNRTVGQFSPFDFIMLVGIGDIMVSTAMDKTISLASGFGGMAALLLLQQVFSFLSLKSNAFFKKSELLEKCIIYAKDFSKFGASFLDKERDLR
jgi:uncharacterized membrane protein YcaP (DUF421 family)